MKRADQITGLIVLILSGLIIAESWRMPRQSESFEPGVGFLPFWLGVLMAVLSVLLIIHSGRLPGDQAKKAIFPGRQPFLAIVLAVMGLAVYIVLLEGLGYLLDTVLFLAFLSAFVMREKWKVTLMVSLGTSIALYVIFQILLKVNLPKNMFGF